RDNARFGCCVAEYICIGWEAGNEMLTNTMQVAEANEGPLGVALSRHGQVQYRLIRQDGRVLLGPCVDEQALESLAHKFIARERQMMQLRQLGCEINLRAMLAVKRG